MVSLFSPSFDRLPAIWIYRFLRWALALVFFYAGATKLADPEAFAVIIEAYGLVPKRLLMPLAVGLPALEVMAAVALMADVKGSLAIVAALLSLFMLILGYGVYMGLDVDCGCFGPGDPEGRAYAGMRAALYRDGILAAGVLLLYGCRYRYRFVPVALGRFRYINRKEEARDALC